jgi:hypothetical protein
MWLLDTLPYYIKEVGMNDFFDDDFDEHDDFNYDNFDDEDRYFDDDIHNDMDDISDNVGPVETETSGTGLEWYEMAFLGGLAEDLADEKRKRQRRREKDRNNPKHKS